MQLLEVRYPDKPARLFIDGVRVSRATWNARRDAGEAKGKVLNCFHTVAKPLPGGVFKRFNYSCMS